MPGRCGACGGAHADDARFCPVCGVRLPEGGQPRLERKTTTVVFVDIVGSTALAEREDPEIVRDVVGRAFDMTEREIARHGGFVEKFIGDAVLAVFGIPAVHEDDPERAVRAALGVRDALAQDMHRAAAEGRPPVEVRIGIETGDLLVDLDRVEGTAHRMLTGDAVNTAARLQQSAEPGQVVVGPMVRSATEGRIRYRSLPAHDLKGKRSPVARWEALRPDAADGATRAPLRLRSRMVGRDAPLRALSHEFERAVSTDTTALISILGPAGIGKSRLGYEFLRCLEADRRTVTVMRGRCLSYGNAPYSAVAQALREGCGIGPQDDPADVARKATATVAELFGDRSLAPHLRALFGVGTDEVPSRDELFAGWRGIVERMAARSPVVMLLEDLHWADEGLLDLVEHVAAWAEGPILLVGLARPDLLERRPSWSGSGPVCRAIRLDPLSLDEVEVMLGDLLGAQPPPNLLHVVSERSEGNPLFGEEIVRMMIDVGAIRPSPGGRWELVGAIDDGAVPRSINALVSARIDSLPADEKALLQISAVVGRTFGTRTLAPMSDLGPARLRRGLEGLEAKELIVRRDAPGRVEDMGFAFRHAVIRDVAYGSLPKADRADKHIAVAHVVEAEAGDRKNEIAETLATHHLRALRWLDELGAPDDRRLPIEEEGFTWAGIAAERCERLWQQREALRWYGAALDLAPRLEIPLREQAQLWERYARTSDGLAPYDDVVRAWEEAKDRYRRVGDDASVGRIEASIANTAIWAGHLDTAASHASRAVERLRPLGESPEFARATFVLGRHALELDDLDGAEPLLHEARQIAGLVDEREIHANASISLGWLLQARHREAQTLELLDDALRTAREAGDLVLLLEALEAVFSAAIEIEGAYARAEELVEESIDLAERSGNIAKLSRGHLNHAYLLREIGRLHEADAEVDRALEAARKVPDPLLIAYGTVVGGLSRCTQGDLEAAERAANLFLRTLDDAGIGRPMYVEEFDGLVRAYVAIGRGDLGSALERLLCACQATSDERLSVWIGQTVLFEAIRALVAVGRRSEGRDIRARLARLALGNTPPRAFLAWADGLIDTAPASALGSLTDAARRFERLDRQVDLGRCLLDLADVEEELELDHRATRARGRSILIDRDARLFLDRPSCAVARTPR